MAVNSTIGLRISREPQCLISTGFDGKLEVDSGLISELESLDKPLVIVAIAGLYRTGKSYLMNRLAGKSDGMCPASRFFFQETALCLNRNRNYVHGMPGFSVLFFAGFALGSTIYRECQVSASYSLQALH